MANSGPPVVISLEGSGDRLEWAVRAADESGAAAIVIAVASAGEKLPDGDPLWLSEVRRPVIAAIDGRLEGRAALVALGADMRVCAGDTIAMLPSGGWGRRRAAQIAGTAALPTAPIPAARLLHLGLVTEVAARGSALAAAERLADVLSRRGPIAVELGKEAVWRGLEMPLEQGLRFETDLTLILQTTKDRAEGVGAFLAKREPRFMGE